jgi:hypothetical protein
MASRRGRNSAAADADQRRQQPAQKLAELHETLSAQVERLAEGAQWRRWLAFASRFHNYSFRNTVLIWAQRPDATLVAGYRAWQDMGRQVRKGERGIQIFAPVTRAPKPDDGTPADGGPVDPDTSKPEPDARRERSSAGRQIVGLRVVHVFDVSQTDGEPLPQQPEPQLLSGDAPPGLWQALAELVGNHDYTLERGDCGQANGRTDFLSRRVRIRADVDDAQAVKTLAHEVGHMLMHDRAESVLACRGIVEVEAESVAYLVATHHGLDTSEFTFQYVTGWAHRTSEDPAEVVRATGKRVIATAQRVLQHTDAALAAGQPPRPDPQLADRVTNGQSRTAAVRQRAARTARAAPPPTPQPAGEAAHAIPARTRHPRLWPDAGRGAASIAVPQVAPPAAVRRHTVPGR